MLSSIRLVRSPRCLHWSCPMTRRASRFLANPATSPTGPGRLRLVGRLPGRSRHGPRPPYAPHARGDYNGSSPPRCRSLASKVIRAVELPIGSHSCRSFRKSIRRPGCSRRIYSHDVLDPGKVQDGTWRVWGLGPAYSLPETSWSAENPSRDGRTAPSASIGSSTRSDCTLTVQGSRTGHAPRDDPVLVGAGVEIGRLIVWWTSERESSTVHQLAMGTPSGRTKTAPVGLIPIARAAARGSRVVVMAVIRRSDLGDESVSVRPAG